ncbi:Uncharacterised protein [Ralstonia pickettii]|uniref:hypothetical protein n=1 Tax=Ralstonia pickettii TaxID=329 RepID=UPI0005061E4A|nr:hypothetical protein [Ralstonia pickettii]KFL18967.1 hypothetical protein DP23_4466 [Ralstonia pickettii]QQK36976.1 hypothetical protein RP6297_03214 [Ralstonia pickettii]UCA15816.1 hypothetical protein LA354_07445 [Ralstonia pickettii]SUE01064.1 Uncharacterised protein [Ralstonia pickettii]
MNCQPGDLAIIVGSGLRNDPDIGKIVKVVEAVPSDGEPCWGVECSVPLLVSLPTGELQYARDASIADRHLKPIRGGDLPMTSTNATPRRTVVALCADLHFAEEKQV